MDTDFTFLHGFSVTKFRTVVYRFTDYTISGRL